MTTLSADEQQVLAERIRLGDRDAERDFVALFATRIRAAVWQRIRDRETARDISQDVLMSAISALRQDRLEHTERLAAFVYGIARNLANNYLRTKARSPQWVELEPGMLVADPRIEVDALERQRLAAQALQDLEPAERQILHMTLSEGLEPADIARTLGLTSEVVRTRKSRALKRLVERIQAMSRSVGPGPPSQ